MSKAGAPKPAKSNKKVKGPQDRSLGEISRHKTAKHGDVMEPPRKSRGDDSSKSAKRETKSILNLEDKAFPRGGASVLTPIERKQIQIQADRDVLFEESGKKRSLPVDGEEEEGGIETSETVKPKKKRRTKVDGHVEAKETDLPIADPIEALSFKKLVPGTLVFGQITHITSRDIALSLPNDLTGYVPITSVSKQLGDRLQKLLDDAEQSEEDDAEEFQDVELIKMFRVGQYLRASVVSNTDARGGKQRKHIELSIDPRVTNTGLTGEDVVVNTTVQASIASVEDGGLVMDLGMDGLQAKGFIGASDIGSGMKLGDMQEGTVLFCMVTGHSGNGRVIKLCSDTTKIGDIKKAHILTNAPTVNAFLPGTAASMIISEATSLGVRGSIMGMLDVTASLIHAGGAQGQRNLESKLKAGEKVNVRVIFSLPKGDGHKLGVSLIDHIVSLSSKSLANKQGILPTDQLPLSSIVDQAKVIRVNTRLGVFVDVGIPRVLALVHVSRLSDQKVDDLSEDTGPYKTGTIHKVRIIGYSPLDGLFYASMEESILKEPFLRIEDVKLGAIVEGTVEDLVVKGEGVTGVFLRLAEGIRGLVGKDHMADVKLKHPERKFRVGMKAKARVLDVNVDKRLIFLTMKKTLVAAESKPWTNYADLEVGDQSPGTITKILDSGATVHFYGRLSAFLPVREMSEAFIKNPREHFQEGQVINVRILSVDADRRRMTVSCKSPSSTNLDQEGAFDGLKVGQTVDGTVTEVTNDMLTLELESGIVGHLRAFHLTDGSEKKNAALLSRMRVGVKLNDLVILEKVLGSSTVRLSNKPSIVQAAKDGKLPATFEDIREKSILNGFVSNITTTGLFVRFGGNVVGLLPTSGMTDDMMDQADQNFGYKIGQSVTSVVANVYPSEQRFTLTLRQSKDGAAKPTETVVPAPIAPVGRPLVNPIDEKLEKIEDIKFGTLTLARIDQVKEQQLNISFADGVQGRIHISEAFKHFAEIKDTKRPLGQFERLSILPVVVLGYHQATTHKYLPLTHRQAVSSVFECSHRQAGDPDPQILSLSKLKEGDEHTAYLFRYSEKEVHASISSEVAGVMDLADLAALVPDYAQVYPVPSALPVIIRRIDSEKERLKLVPKGLSERPKFEEGEIHAGHISRVHMDGIDVEMDKRHRGFVPLAELSDNFDDANPKRWKLRDVVKYKVLSRSSEKTNHKTENRILSVRPSLIGEGGEDSVKDPHVASNTSLETSQVIRGFVKDVTNKGLFVRVGWNAIAHVPVHEVSDEYIKDLETRYTPRQLVKGKLIHVDAESGHHKMSLRESVVNNAKYKPALTFDDVKQGDVVDAKVHQINTFGVFIVIANSKNVRGLCHRTELADAKIEDPAAVYSIGDKVKAKIIKIDRDRKRISFSLKAKHFRDLPEEVDSESSDDNDVDEEMGGVDLDNIQDAPDNQSEVAVESDEEMEDVVEERGGKKRVSTGGLQVAGFDWTGVADEDEGGVVIDTADSEQPKKKKRRKAEIQIDKTGDLDKLGPQSVSDFERLLLGQPNSSALWIQYMAFQLGLSEVEKARDIAERALRTIHMREEEEKMNVWIARLNLENAYGTEESLQEVFDRACEYSDKKEINERLASIFIDSGKHKEAEALFERMRKIRDISTDLNYWLNYATFLMTTVNQPDAARALLTRATQALPTSQHPRLIARFGKLEFQSPNGDIERGRTIFEGLVSTYPKNPDLWDLYLAQELSARGVADGDTEKVRALYERMAGMKMKPKRARFVFKQWLAWETQMAQEGKGDDKAVAKVRVLAEEYVEKQAQAKEDAEAGAVEEEVSKGSSKKDKKKAR